MKLHLVSTFVLSWAAKSKKRTTPAFSLNFIFIFGPYFNNLFFCLVTTWLAEEAEVGGKVVPEVRVHLCHEVQVEEGLVMAIF